jgi:hypothetical protein
MPPLIGGFMISRICVLLVLWTGSVQAQSPDPSLVAKVLAEGRIKDQVYAESVVLAAQAVATSDFPIELLLGLADVESDFAPTATSRLIDGVRQTGEWKSNHPPKGATGNFFCGITQAIAPTWKRCLELRDPKVAMTALAGELDYWLKRSGSVMGALQGHGCGNVGMQGACRPYAASVMRQARLFRVPRPTI